jgi:hypothetical protein
MKSLRNTNISIIIFLFLFSCSNNQNKGLEVDEFYTEKGEWDSTRLPLLKPYEAVITSKEDGWFINLQGRDGDSGLPHIQKVLVSNGVIF